MKTDPVSSRSNRVRCGRHRCYGQYPMWINFSLTDHSTSSGSQLLAWIPIKALREHVGVQYETFWLELYLRSYFAVGIYLLINPPNHSEQSWKKRIMFENCKVFYLCFSMNFPYHGVKYSSKTGLEIQIRTQILFFSENQVDEIYWRTRTQKFEWLL